ncbi:MAG: Wzz/FepE/Etk N-terminal domain-containing protein [Rhizomicrobium sp.]|jgi:hypothetical protein
MSDIPSDDAGETESKFLDIAKLRFEFRTYYLLFIAVFAAFFAVAAVFVFLVEPVYTATALVGPADNSDQPFGLDAAGLGSGIGSAVKHLHVGGLLGQNNDDSFNEYVSLLTSTRLASVLVNKDHILPEIFPKDWDAVNKRWYPRDNPVDQAIDAAKRVLKRPVKPAPDVDDLIKFFDQNLNVDLSLETSFATVTLKFRDPVEAERILNLVLLEADNIIREDKRRDVSARIAYLNMALERLTLADQKPAMIDVLSQQQQEMMMIESDHRYASTLIDQAHAPLKPTSPVPTLDAAIAFGLSCLAWFGLVRLAPESGQWRRFVNAFARPRVRRRRRANPAVAAKAQSPAAG